MQANDYTTEDLEKYAIEQAKLLFSLGVRKID